MTPAAIGKWRGAGGRAVDAEDGHAEHWRWCEAARLAAKAAEVHREAMTKALGPK